MSPIRLQALCSPYDRLSKHYAMYYQWAPLKRDAVAAPAQLNARAICQPVAEVLEYLHVQISPISCNVVGSIQHVHGQNTDTAIVGYRWTGVGGHHGLYC